MLKDLDLPSNETLIVLALVHYGTDLLPMGETHVPPSVKDLRAVGEENGVKSKRIDAGLQDCLRRGWLQCSNPETKLEELRFLLTTKGRMGKAAVQQALFTFGPETALDDLPKWCLAGRDEQIVARFRRLCKFPE